MDEGYNEIDKPSYKAPQDIHQAELVNGLCRLSFLSEDPFLRMQAHNLALVDEFLMKLEYKALHDLIKQERTPPEVAFLSAQSQMWIFAAYELLRTWRELASNLIKWADNGGLEAKLKQYEKTEGYNQIGRSQRAKQIKQVLADKSKIDSIKTDLRIVHILFSRLEAIRIFIAKHQITGNPKSVAFMPGYGRINRECGSLDYQLENEAYIIGNISRRDIADEIRAILSAEIPSQNDIKSFDMFMSGKISEI